MFGIEEEAETLFLDSLAYQGELLTVDINIMERIVTLRIDVGADVTVISQALPSRMIFKELKSRTDSAARIGLKKLKLRAADKIYVVKNFSMPLLERPAVEGLGFLI